MHGCCTVCPSVHPRRPSVGAGKPLAPTENAFEAMSGDALAHRILKNAGCAPAWVEQAAPSTDPNRLALRRSLRRVNGRPPKVW